MNDDHKFLAVILAAGGICAFMSAIGYAVFGYEWWVPIGSDKLERWSVLIGLHLVLLILGGWSIHLIIQDIHATSARVYKPRR